MTLSKKHIAIAMTGSFCTLNRAFVQMEYLVTAGAKVDPIISHSVDTITSRFGHPQMFKNRIQEITGKMPMTTIQEAEHLGPSGGVDALVIMPCTGNTLAKLAHGITDSSVLMAAKAQLRNERPVIIALATNDALGRNAKNIGRLLNQKHIFFVPFGQDQPKQKPHSLIADISLLPKTLACAMGGKQYQPLIITYPQGKEV